MGDGRAFKDWEISFSGHQDTGGRWCDEARVQLAYPGGVYRRLLGGEVFFKTQEEATASAWELAMDWIDNDGRIPLSQIDPAGFPFQFSIGDRVRSRVLESAKGLVCEGFFSGDRVGQYKITYRIKREDGVLCFSPEKDLEALEQ